MSPRRPRPSSRLDTAEHGQILWYTRGRARAHLREAAIMPLNNWGRIRRTVLRRLLSIAREVGSPTSERSSLLLLSVAYRSLGRDMGESFAKTGDGAASGRCRALSGPVCTKHGPGFTRHGDLNRLGPVRHLRELVHLFSCTLRWRIGLLCRTASTRTALTASQPPVRGIQSLSRTVIGSTWVCGGSDGSSDVTISRSLPAVLCADVGCPPSRVHCIGASAKSLK